MSHGVDSVYSLISSPADPSTYILEPSDLNASACGVPSSAEMSCELSSVIDQPASPVSSSCCSSVSTVKPDGAGPLPLSTVQPVVGTVSPSSVFVY